MKKCTIVVLLFLTLIVSGCGRQPTKNSNPTSTEQMAEDIFTIPTENSTLPTNPIQDAGSSVRIVNDVQQDEAGYYLVYEGGEMHLKLQMCAMDLEDKNFGIHLYVDDQPQPYYTDGDRNPKYMHTFSSMNGREFTLDLIFTPVTGQAGDVLEIGFAAIANPEYSPAGSEGLEEITMIDWSCMGMTVRTKFLADPPDSMIPDVLDRVSDHIVEHIDLTAAEAELLSLDEHQKEVEYAIYVSSQKDYGNLFSVKPEDILDVEFNLKGSTVPNFGLVLYLDHQPVSITDEDLIFACTENGKRVVIRAQVDLSGFDGECVFYAVLVPRNYRIDQLGGSCSVTILGPWYLSSAESLEAIH